jgi:hypothetical protein
VAGIANNAKPIWLLSHFRNLVYSIKLKPFLNHPESSMFTDFPVAAMQARLHDLAKVEAQRLRREALQHVGGEAVDDFWRGANAVWQRSLQTGQTVAERSAARLQARLARHRPATSSCVNCPPATGASVV